MMQETPRKYTKPTYTISDPKGDRMPNGKDDVKNDIRKMGIVNWMQVVQDRDGWRKATREVLILLG
jgi:hypothetical protein